MSELDKFGFYTYYCFCSIIISWYTYFLSLCSHSLIICGCDLEDVSLTKKRLVELMHDLEMLGLVSTPTASQNHTPAFSLC